MTFDAHDAGLGGDELCAAEKGGVCECVCVLSRLLSYCVSCCVFGELADCHSHFGSGGGRTGPAAAPGDPDPGKPASAIPRYCTDFKAHEIIILKWDIVRSNVLILNIGR